MTEILHENDINRIVSKIKAGKIIAFPTETVYGVGVTMGDKEALKKLYQAKNRDLSKAITLMVASKEDIPSYGIVDEVSKKIIDAFMPGMLTVVLSRHPDVDPFFTGGKDTIGIRIPDHPFVLEILEKAGPMLVTSANISDAPNTTNVKEVLDQLDGRIDYVVEGYANSTVASTVIDLSNGVQLLRQGKITLEMIKEALK